MVIAVDSDSTWHAEVSELISYSNYSNCVNDACFFFPVLRNTIFKMCFALVVLYLVL